MIPSQSTEVDVPLSMQLVEALVFYIAEHIPDVRHIYFVSDNGPHFASHDMLLWMESLNQQLGDANHTLVILAYDFPEPTTAKSRLDTHFSYTKKKLLNYIKYVGDVTTPQQMFDALTYEYVDGCSAMVKSSIAVVVDPKAKDKSIGSVGTKGKDALAKQMGIRRILSANYLSDKSIVLRDVSGLGGGKRYRWNPNVAFAKTMLQRGSTGTRFDTTNTSKFKAAEVAAKRKPSRRRAHAGYTPLQEVLKEGYEQFESSHQQSQAEGRQELLAGSGPVDDVLAELDGVELSRTVVKSKKKGDGETLEPDDDRQVEKLQLPRAQSSFGLAKAGYAIRINQRKNPVPKRIYQYLVKQFDEGLIGPKHRPAQVHEQLMKTELRTNWRARIVVTPSSIKALFSSLAQRSKKKQKEATKTAAEASQAAPGTGSDPTTGPSSSASPAVNNTAVPGVVIVDGVDDSLGEVVVIGSGLVGDVWRQENVFEPAQSILSAVEVASGDMMLSDDEGSDGD
jgi:hypothetical protein